MNKITPFKNLKIALLMINSNRSVIEQGIRTYKSVLEMHHWSQMSITSSFQSDDFEVVIANDFLPPLTVKQRHSMLIIEYIDNFYISTKSIIGNSNNNSYNIQIDDISTKDELFTLSTVRDFYDIDFNTIDISREVHQHFHQIYLNRWKI